MNNFSNGEWQLTDEELIKLGREVVKWSMPQPPMATYKETLAAFNSRTNEYGRLIGFADAVSDVLYGGECAWCNIEDRLGYDGLSCMVAELRKRK